MRHLVAGRRQVFRSRIQHVHSTGLGVTFKNVPYIRLQNDNMSPSNSDTDAFAIELIWIQSSESSGRFNECPSTDPNRRLWPPSHIPGG
jgi:hypothetical protein